MPQDDKYAYLAEWRDTVNGVTWKYQLNLYIETEEVEMLDLKNKRIFLRRCLIPGSKLVPELLRPGALVTILARQLRITGFADHFTHSALGKRQERILVLVKSDAIVELGATLQQMLDAGFVIGEMRMCSLTEEEAIMLSQHHDGIIQKSETAKMLSCGRLVVLELVASDAMTKWREALEKEVSSVAAASASSTLGDTPVRNLLSRGCIGTLSQQSAQRVWTLFFEQKVGRSLTAQDGALCLIKPHALLDSKLGQIVSLLSEKFTIVAMQSCQFDVKTASKLLQLYQRILPLSEYSSMVEELCSGPAVAIEVQGQPGEGLDEALREFCGPSDPLMARALRSGSLRAKFGRTKAMNAVHCTDLEEDRRRELLIAFQ